MSLTLKQAASEVGLTKPALLKAIQKGKLSAKKNNNGHWRIEPSELFRAYTPYKPVNTENNKPLAIGNGEVNGSLHLKNRELELKLEAAAQEIEALKVDKEDYKARLDQESEERRKLTMMLTNEQQKPPKKGFFSFLRSD